MVDARLASVTVRDVGWQGDGALLQFVSTVLELRNGAFDVKTLAGFHVVHVFGHWAVGVPLDDEVNGALLVYIADRRVRADDGLLHLRALVLCDDGGYEVSVIPGGMGWLDIQATWRPLSMSSSGSKKVSFLVLWLMTSDLSSFSDRKPCSPPVKAAFAALSEVAGIFCASAEGGALPAWPVGVPRRM